MNRYLALSVLSIVAVSAFPNSAWADPIVAKDGRGDIYVSGLTSYQTLQAEYSSIPRSRMVSANECGFFRLRSSTSYPFDSSSSLKLDNGTAFTVSSLPLEAAPRCTQGQLDGANTSPSALLRTSEGDIYFTGLSDYSEHKITFNDLASARNVRANTCGIARLSNSGNYQISSGALTIKDRESGSTVASVSNYSTLTQVSGGPICRQGSAFYANDWPTN